MGLGLAIMGFFSANLTILTWIVGIVLAIILIVITFRYNLAKIVIIIATAIGGAAAAIGTLVVGVDNVQLLTFFQNPVQVMLSGSFIWTLLFVVMAVAGIVSQIQVNRSFEIDTYNRLTSAEA